MAGNGLQQLREPGIGEFANCQRPKPVHNEINAWQHILNLIYKEALQRNVIDKHMQEATAGSGVSGRKPGCGLSFVASKIREHYNDKDHRSNNLTATIRDKSSGHTRLKYAFSATISLL